MTSSNKVTIIGHSGAGKTCFLYSLFGKMQTGDYDHSEANPIPFLIDASYRIVPSDPTKNIMKEEAGRLSASLNQEWERLRIKASDRFPLPTPVTMKYGFKLVYDYSEVINFEWVDYRGGILKGFENSTDDKNYFSLLEQLQESSCLICCLSASYFIDFPQQKTSINEIAGDINRLITDANSKGNLKFPFPIVILITKSDKLDLANLFQSSTFYEKIKNAFPPLFASDRWRVMICPVTLFGDGLDGDNAEIDSEIKPKKLFLPLAFALFHCLENLIEETQKKLNDRYKNQIESSINVTNSKIQAIKTRQNEIMNHPPRSWERVSSWFSGEIGELEKKIVTVQGVNEN